jgi:hypothetical protein
VPPAAGGACITSAPSRYVLGALHINQVQLDELYAVLRAVTEGARRADEALPRLERAQHWVWTALEPESKLLLAIAVGPRMLAMAQGIVQQVMQGLAPACLLLFRTDGFTEYGTALLSHGGHGMLPERQRAQGPAPKPRGMPLPQLL